MFYKSVTPGKQLTLFSILKWQYALVKILLKMSEVRSKMSLLATVSYQQIFKRA